MIGKPNLYALVGMKFRNAEAFVAKLTPDVPLMLVREPDNKFDRNAVQVWAKDGDAWRHVAYISKDQNAVLSRFIDQQGKAWAEPQPILAMDAPAPETFKVQQAVDARLHAGRNTYPLCEVI
jgi:hypothetical protein